MICSKGVAVVSGAVSGFCIGNLPAVLRRIAQKTSTPTTTVTRKAPTKPPMLNPSGTELLYDGDTTVEGEFLALVDLATIAGARRRAGEVMAESIEIINW